MLCVVILTVFIKLQGPELSAPPQVALSLTSATTVCSAVVIQPSTSGGFYSQTIIYPELQSFVLCYWLYYMLQNVLSTVRMDVKCTSMTCPVKRGQILHSDSRQHKREL